MESKICCLLNFASHYREDIYLLLEKKIDCIFYFGDIDKGKLKELDYSRFKHTPTVFQTKRVIANFTWIKGSLKLAFQKKYRTYLLTGDPFCITDWLLLCFCKLLGKKTYMWTHGWYGHESSFRKILKKVFFSFPSGIFLYGERAEELMIKEGFNSQKLHVVYNSLSYDNQLVVRKELKTTFIYQEYFKNDNPVLIFTGRLTNVKKLDQIIDAHKILKDKDYELNVIFVGSGSEEDALKKKVSDSNLEDYYWFYGSCYDEQVIAELYYNALVCVSPGNVGLTAIHSFMYGCPVISHDNFSDQMPEVEVIEDGMTGCYFKQNDIYSLASTIEQIVKSTNTEAREVLRQSCFSTIDFKYNPHYQIEVFRKVLSV